MKFDKAGKRKQSQGAKLIDQSLYTKCTPNYNARIYKNTY